MKSILAITLLITSMQAFSADNTPCKVEAETRASIVFSSENPEVGFSLRSKFRPLLEEKRVSHILEIREFDSNRVTYLTVTLNPTTCNVLSVD